jgi:hypothetical protein
MSATITPSNSSLLSNQLQKPIAFQSKSKSGLPIYVSAPFCDKITIKGAITIVDIFKSAISQGDQPDQYLEKLALEARHTLRQSKKDLAAAPYFQFKFKGRKVGHVGGHKRLGPDAASTGIYVANRLSAAKTGFAVTIEANPARLGPQGLNELDDLFTLLFGEEINFRTWIQRATVPSIDVAVDIYNLEMRDLIFHPHENRKWSNYFDADLAIETASRLTKRKNKWVPTLRIYDKSAQMKEAGKPSQPAMQTVRVEARLALRRQFYKLRDLENPFDKLTLGYLPEATSGETKGLRNAIHASMRVGLGEAMADVPDELRPALLLARNARATFWRPDEIWKAWPSGLAHQGLLHLIEVSQPTPSGK